MGNPIRHSKSPQIHARFAEQCGIELEYTAIQVDPGGFVQAVGNFQANGGRGLNITVPFKGEAWRLALSLSARAQAAQAVNTLCFENDGRIHGDNTDGAGLMRDLQENLGYTIAGRRVLLLGAGGAARGILPPLLEGHPAEIIIANRTVARALALANACRGRVSASGFDHVSGRFDLVLNATAASLSGKVPPLPDELFTDGSLAYDLMYGDTPTAFMRWAARAGATRVSDGLGMLVEQAAESFSLWHGVRPETAVVIAAVRGEAAGVIST